MENIATDFKPFGMLGGMYAGQNAANAQITNEQAMQKSALEQMIKQKEVAFAQDEMNNPEVRAMRLQGMIGKDQQSQAAGVMAKATNESDIKAKIAENVAKIPKAELESQLAQHNSEFNALRMLDMAGESSGYQGLDFDQKLLQIGKAVNMPQQELQKFMQSPAQQRGAMLKSRLGKLEQILTLTPKVLQEMTTKDREFENQEIIHQGDRESREKISAADNASRSADRAAAREAAKQNKTDNEAMRKEAELSRRIQVIISEAKANENELKRVSEEAASIATMPLPGMTKQEKQVARSKMRSALESEKKSLEEEQARLRSESKRIAGLSSFADKQEAGKPQAGTADNPIVLK